MAFGITSNSFAWVVAQVLGDISHTVVVELSDLLLLLGLLPGAPLRYWPFASAICPSRPYAVRSSCRIRGRAIEGPLDQRCDVLGFRRGTDEIWSVNAFNLRFSTNDLRAQLIDFFPDDAALTFKRCGGRLSN